MAFLAQAIVWLNAVANALGTTLLAPIAVLPGWLSATVIAAVTGILMLVVFKYTSNQRAIKRVRSDIKVNLLALKLFKDSLSVTFRAQGRLFLDAFLLLVLAVVPMLVMIVPVMLILGQLALWYQSRPLKIKEEAVVTLKLNGNFESLLPKVALKPNEAMKVETGPVRVLSQGEVCWKIAALQDGYHRLVFDVDGQTAEKELAVGNGVMRVSMQRPGWSWWDAMLHPAEPPFSADGPIKSIEIDYPERHSWTCGAQPVLLGMPAWMVFWFIVSMIAAFAFRGLLKVNI